MASAFSIAGLEILYESFSIAGECGLSSAFSIAFSGSHQLYVNTARENVPLHRKTPVYTAGRTCFQQIMLNTGTVRMKLSESIAERFRASGSQGKQLDDRIVQLIVCGVFPMLELADVFSWWGVACGKSKVSV